jgi:ubiquinone/menaquinone biosynthesis C-methylase UbiE
MTKEAKELWEGTHIDPLKPRPISKIAYSSFRKKIKKGETVGELAFGSADNLKALQEKVKEGRVVGIDFSQKAILRAKKELEGKPDIEVINADIHDLGVRNNTFDKLLLVDFFGMYPKEKSAKLLKEAHRVLKPGGLLMFTTYLHERGKTEGFSTTYPFDKEEIRAFIKEHLGFLPPLKINTISLSGEAWKKEIKKMAKEKLKAHDITESDFPHRYEKILAAEIEEQKEKYPLEQMHLVYLKKPK